MLVNGFFPHEALIVGPANQKGEHIVWEGNRRLTALKIINRDECGEEIPDPLLGEAVPSSLRAVPVVEVSDYEDVRTYIGYRHITGLKTWPAEAKARFILKAVEDAIDAGDNDPLKTVGKVIGSNSAGVRTSLLPILALRKAEEGKISTAEIRTERFGVWERLWSSGGFREYIEMPQVRDFSEISSAINELNVDKLGEAVQDLSRKSNGPALVRDSRSLDQYGKVLANPIARQVLRETDDLSAAAQIIESDVLEGRFENVLKRLTSLKREVEVVEPEVLKQSGVAKSAKLIRSEALTIHSLVEESNQL